MRKSQKVKNFTLKVLLPLIAFGFFVYFGYVIGDSFAEGDQNSYLQPAFSVLFFGIGALPLLLWFNSTAVKKK